MQQITTKHGFKSRDQLLKELNKDYFSGQIELPLHVTITDKFLIQTEKYLKVLRAKYDRDKKAILNRSFFTQEPDFDIEMGESDKSDSDDESIETNDDNLYSSSDEDGKEQEIRVK